MVLRHDEDSYLYYWNKIMKKYYLLSTGVWIAVLAVGWPTFFPYFWRIDYDIFSRFLYLFILSYSIPLSIWCLCGVFKCWTKE